MVNGRARRLIGAQKAARRRAQNAADRAADANGAEDGADKSPGWLRRAQNAAEASRAAGAAEEPGLCDGNTLSALREIGDALMAEADLQAAITDALTLYGWNFHHETDSRRSRPGFPDIVAAHPDGGPVLMWELKTATGRVTAEQEEWIDTLTGRPGIHARVVRPADLERALDLIARRCDRTWRLLAPTVEPPAAELETAEAC